MATATQIMVPLSQVNLKPLTGVSLGVLGTVSFSTEIVVLTHPAIPMSKDNIDIEINGVRIIGSDLKTNAGFTYTRVSASQTVFKKTDGSVQSITFYANLVSTLATPLSFSVSTLGSIDQGYYLALPALTLTGGPSVGAITWTAVSGLPTGLSLSSTTGIISGTCTASSAIYPTIIRAIDSVGHSIEVTLDLTVVSQPTTTTTPEPGWVSIFNQTAYTTDFGIWSSEGQLTLTSGTNWANQNIWLNINQTSPEWADFNFTKMRVTFTGSAGFPVEVSAYERNSGNPNLYPDPQFSGSAGMDTLIIQSGTVTYMSYSSEESFNRNRPFAIEFWSDSNDPIVITNIEFQGRSSADYGTTTTTTTPAPTGWVNILNPTNFYILDPSYGNVTWTGNNTNVLAPDLGSIGLMAQGTFMQGLRAENIRATFSSSNYTNVNLQISELIEGGGISIFTLGNLSTIISGIGYPLTYSNGQADIGQVNIGCGGNNQFTLLTLELFNITHV
jgi:hypothetical protein